jgi:hypothetical protein
MRGEVELAEKMFAQVPPDWGKIDALLSEAHFSDEELAAIAIDLTDDCFCEYNYAINEDFPDLTPENMHSNYLLQSLQTLLDHGLDPNTIYNEENVLWNIQFINAPGAAGSAMRLLMEYGGNPNHCIPDDDETLFDSISFDVSYDKYTHEYEYTVQCWLVLMAYGGCWSDGEIPLKMLGGHSAAELKNFESIDYSIEPLPPEPNRYGCWIMHVFSKDTGEEIARYK